MSYANVKAQLASALAAVTWSIPPSASAILNPQLKTQFGYIDTRQFAGEETVVATDQQPYVRVYLPDPHEKRLTDGGDAGSIKEQRFTTQLFIYQSGFTKDWQGLSDYFDAVVDGTMAYFRRNSAPQGQGVVAGDVIRAWGLRMGSRIELPSQFGAELVFRATVAVDIVNDIV